jgi:drug/metabolite transporter (DMT)-like permease
MSGLQRSLVWNPAEDRPPLATLSRPVVYALLVTAMLILGLNWPVMATALQSITPIWMAAIRVGGAAIAVGIVALLSGNLVVPPRRDLPMIISVSIFRLGAVMVLVFFALRLVPAGRASVLVWTTSLWTVPLAALFLGERMTRRKWLGISIGIAGVIVLSEIWRNDWSETSVSVGVGLLILAATVSAATAVHIRRHHWTIRPLQALPWQLIGAVVPLIILGLIVDGPPAIEWSQRLVWIMVYQAVLASGVAFWAQIVVLRNLSAVSTNLTMMGVPVIGVISSSLALDEAITTTLLVGMVLVMAGVTMNLSSTESDELLPADRDRP